MGQFESARAGYSRSISGMPSSSARSIGAAGTPYFCTGTTPVCAPEVGQPSSQG